MKNRSTIVSHRRQVGIRMHMIFRMLLENQNNEMKTR